MCNVCHHFHTHTHTHTQTHTHTHTQTHTHTHTYTHTHTHGQAKTKLDVRKSPKACFKLRRACERAKKTLSANADAPLSVECLMDDRDFTTQVRLCVCVCV